MNKQKYKVGQKIKVGDSYIKIMAFAEGYYMARRKGCFPFVSDEKEIDVRISAWCNSLNEKGI